jgi:hypothetical protein
MMPHRVDESSIPAQLRIVHRSLTDPHHYEITPRPGANLTVAEYEYYLAKIRTVG